jgi:hypothetical protein
MTFALYEATVPQFLQILPGVTRCLDKAEAWATEHGLTEAEMLANSIAPDMWPLAQQVRASLFFSAEAVKASLSGELRPDPSPAPLDFAALRAHHATALAYLQDVDPAVLDARQDEEVAFRLREDYALRFTVRDFLLTFAQPNFFFHATATYIVLRDLGLPMSKPDYLGRPRLL